MKVAIVTGGSSGIGRAAAISLSAAGWSVVLTARNQVTLKETADLCHGPTLIIPGDITQEITAQNLFKQTLERFGAWEPPQWITCLIDNREGRLDLLFNNAGVSGPRDPIEIVSLAEFRACLDTNLTAAFLCTREAIRIFKTQDPPGGRIINNGSLAAHVPRPNSIAYTCSKHAIAGLTKATALEGRSFNITCTQLDIGNALTPMVLASQTANRAHQEGTCDVQHVADAVVHIASLPNSVTVLDFTIMATDMPYVGRG